jgi:ribonuclease BN (tRNA processing enzyme)
MATIKFLGTGSSFTLDNFQTNFLLTLDNGYRLLVDCGSDIRHALKAHTDLTYLDIDGVYISHLHADHTRARVAGVRLQIRSTAEGQA